MAAISSLKFEIFAYAAPGNVSSEMATIKKKYFIIVLVGYWLSKYKASAVRNQAGGRIDCRGALRGRPTYCRVSSIRRRAATEGRPYNDYLLCRFSQTNIAAMKQHIGPTSEQVDDARELLRRFLRPTRLVRAERIGRDTDAHVYLKLETELPTGSFKLRGAIYALMKTLAQRSIKGIVAASTGNHGAAVAYAARLAQLPATIFLPESPNPIKRARIVALGANVKEVEWTPESLE